jgi:hypothetical protein
MISKNSFYIGLARDNGHIIYDVTGHARRKRYSFDPKNVCEITDDSSNSFQLQIPTLSSNLKKIGTYNKADTTMNVRLVLAFKKQGETEAF